MKNKQYQAVDVTNDNQMVALGLRQPPLFRNMFVLQAENSNKAHSDKDKAELRSRKKFHKEYGQKLNNQKTKDSLLHAIVNSMKDATVTNFKLTLV